MPHNNLMHVYVLSRFSRVLLFATLWTVAHHTPLSKGFSRQEYWSRLPCPPPGDLLHPGIEPRSLALKADSLLLSHQGNLQNLIMSVLLLSTWENNVTEKLSHLLKITQPGNALCPSKQTRELLSFPVSFAQFIWPKCLPIPVAHSCLPTPLAESSRDPFSPLISRSLGWWVWEGVAGSQAGRTRRRAPALLNGEFSSSCSLPGSQVADGPEEGVGWAVGLLLCQSNGSALSPQILLWIGCHLRRKGFCLIWVIWVAVVFFSFTLPFL